MVYFNFIFDLRALLLLLVSILNYILNSSPCCCRFILFGALVAPVYFELEPLLLSFYFIWGPCCSCLF